MIHDSTNCILGEGALWHPQRNALFWFDIVNCRLHTSGRHWQFDEMVSAAAWIDKDRLLIASETKLFTYDLETGATVDLVSLEADNPETRSNDGRADPHGGFWIGTMSKSERKGGGAFYRYYAGELRKLWDGITVTNAQCFSPDGRTAYFSDTPTHKVMRVALDEQGWPCAEPEVHLDFSAQSWYPDGACTDAVGNIWIAFWGRAMVQGFALDGSSLGQIEFGCPQTTCPAFGGPDFRTLFCTSAARDLADGNPANGNTFSALTSAQGRAEPAFKVS